MSTPQPATLVLKVISIDDLGVNIVELPAGTYLVDGEVVSHGGWNSYNTKHQISAKDVENIRAVYKTNILVEYVMSVDDGSGDTMPVESYNHIKAELTKSGTFDGADEDEYIWDSLDAEFAYRKFVSFWKPKYKEEITYSEPLLIDRSHIRQDSGNPYIVAGFLTGRSDVPLYSYNRSTAVASMLAKKFESLGMEFKEGLSYGATEGKKIWSNSTHSGLEYVTAFGKYIIGKNLVPKTRGEFKGSFEHLEKIYKEDKQWIEDLIQVGYNLHFRNEGASTVLLGDVYSGLKTCISYVNTMEVKVKSETSKRSALAQLNKLLETVSVEVLK
jgi:hypothetical protein